MIKEISKEQLAEQKKSFVRKSEKLNEGKDKTALCYHFGLCAERKRFRNNKGFAFAIWVTVSAMMLKTADVAIFNTCAVRENAELKVFGYIGALKNIKAQRPDMLIGICGCMIQQKHIAEKIKNLRTC